MDYVINPGNFAGQAVNGSLLLATSAIKAIRDEIEMQMQRFRELGFTSKRIDSHDWLLFNLPIWFAVKPLLKQYGFEKTRIACENWIRTKNTLLQMYYKYMANTISSSLQAESSWSGGLRSFERAVDRKIITADTVAEIMTHPDLINGELTDTSNHAEIPFTEVVCMLETMYLSE